MKRLITFVMVFILGFFVVFVGVNAQVNVLPENTPDLEFTELQFIDYFEDYDFLNEEFKIIETFDLDFNLVEYGVHFTDISIAIDIVADNDYPLSDFDTGLLISINNQILFDTDVTIVAEVYGSESWVYTILIESPTFIANEYMLNQGANAYTIEMDNMQPFGYLNVTYANSTIRLYREIDPIRDEYWFGYNAGYDNGRSDFGQYFPPGSADGLEGWYGYQDGYDYGFDLGFDDGINYASDYSFSGLLGEVFIGLGSLLAINLLPGVSIGAIIAVPVVFGIIAFILGKRGGKDD